MAQFYICCTPGGGCTVLPCGHAAFPPCTTVRDDCRASGGWEFGETIYNFNPTPTTCQTAYDLINGGASYLGTCGDIRVCQYGPSFESCVLTTYADCRRNYDGIWRVDLLSCPINVGIEVKMFPTRSAYPPYHRNLSSAQGGFWPDAGIHSLDCGADPAILRRHFFRQNHSLTNCDAMEGFGRFRRFKKFQCFETATGLVVPGVVDEAACLLIGGREWKDNGLVYLEPTQDMNVHDDGAACAKWAKNFVAQGFWRPDRFPKVTGCFDPQTYAALPAHSTKQPCEDAGKMWLQNQPIKPPQWNGWFRARSMGPAQVGLEIATSQGQVVVNFPGAQEYRFAAVLPVPPPYPGAPYEFDPNWPAFPANDARTPSIYCVNRNDSVNSGQPYFNECGSDHPRPVYVEPGLRALVCESTAPPFIANLSAYCPNGTYGCPATPDCYSEKCYDVFENVTRKYRAIGAENKYDWTADPENRGWWIAYTAEVDIWFVQDCHYISLDAIDPSEWPPQRWAAWYSGKIRFLTNGDPNLGAFRDWILTHDAGFGVEFEPRYGGCNDALWRWWGLPKALADSVYPPAAIQTQCLDPGEPDNILESGPGQVGHFPPVQPPCLNGGHGPSSWYHTGLGAPAPEAGLPHQTVRKRFLNAAGLTYATEYGWALLAFGSTPIYISGAP